MHLVARHTSLAVAEHALEAVSPAARIPAPRTARRRVSLFLLTLFVALLSTTAPASAAVVHDEDGTIRLVDVLADARAMVYLGPVDGEPARLLVTNVYGAFWIELVENEARVVPFEVPFGETDAPRPGEIEAVLDDAAALLDASRPDWIGSPPPLLLDVHHALADRRPRPIELLAPGDLPPYARSCFGSSMWREVCDNCCENEWREARDDCRKKLDDDSRMSQHKCLQYAAISLATCTARCSALPVKPPGGRDGGRNAGR